MKHIKSSVVRRTLVALGFLSFAAGSIASHAQGWYGGIGVGQSKVDVDSVQGLVEDYTFFVYGLDCSDAGISCSSSEDDKDTAFKLFAGFRVNKHFAVEGMFVDLGEATAKASLTDGVDTISLNASAEADGFAVAAVGFLPVSDTVSLLGKIGMFRWSLDAKATLTDTALAISESASESESGTDPMFGFGAEFALGKQWGARVEWEKFKDIGDEDTTGQSDVDLLSLSVLYKF